MDDRWLSALAAQELGLGDTELLDTTDRQLVVGGRRVDLTPLEFDVMSYLYERAGTPVDRRDLLADIRGYDAEIGSNVVDSVVHQLRKKLRDRAGRLETVRGVGYRLTD